MARGGERHGPVNCVYPGSGLFAPLRPGTGWEHEDPIPAGT